MDSEKIGLRSKQTLAVITRLKALYYYVYEMAEGFGVDHAALDSIEKGVWKRQIIRDIIIKYRNNEGVVLGKVIISIDWEKHHILAKTDDGKSFKVDSGKSIHSQISTLSDILIKHVTKMRNTLPITKISTSFEYVEEIDNDREKKDAAMKYLGHVYGKKDVVDIESEFTHSISHIAKNLKEVEITIMNS